MLQRHPLSALLPDFTPEEFIGLRESILRIGVQEPIVLFEGMVLEGWNRYSICSQEHVTCPSRLLDEATDPVEYVRSRTRGRNMSQSQLALLEVSLREWRGTGRPAGNPAAAAGFSAATSAEMAAEAGVSERIIRQAKVVHAQAVEPVRQAVKDGKLSAERAAHIAKLPADEQEPALTAPRALAVALEAAANPAPAAGFEEDAYDSPMQLLEQQEVRIKELEAIVAAVQADDTAAKIIQLQTQLMVAQRRSGELQQAVAEREGELKKQANILRALGDLLDEPLPNKLVAAVKALKANA
jgi:ParB-like chromosome segregation protein Spo0J